MRRQLIGLLLGVLSLAWSGEAAAQYSVPSQATGSDEAMIIVQDEPPHREKEAPSRPWELGASLNFLTSKPSLAGEALEFTDVMLLRLHALVFLGQYEIFAGNDILPKQPSYTDELVWQGSLLGLRTTFNNQNSAWARVQVGPQLDRDGYWYSAEAAVQYRLALQKVLFFESSLGWSHTQLSFKEDVDRFFHVDEVFTKVGVALRDPDKGRFASWLSFDYFYPVLGGPPTDNPDPQTGRALDPQPRVNVHLGALAAVTKRTDLFFEYSILDRGDLENGETTLPILNTGFDQEQIIFGFMHHFGGERR